MHKFILSWQIFILIYSGSETEPQKITAEAPKARKCKAEHISDIAGIQDKNK